MRVGESPSYDRERVAADPTYNLATGTRILADKWRAVACVGDRQPETIEHWYSAAWAYNGLAYSNNPNNPNYASNRGPWNPAVGGAAPYQEKVWGYMIHATRWAPTALAYPDLADIGGDARPAALPEPSCASPTSCAERRPTHRTSCASQGPSSPDAGVPPGDAGGSELVEDGEVSGGCGGGMRAALLLVVLLRRRRR
jgi:hypothetical protein